MGDEAGVELVTARVTGLGTTSLELTTRDLPDRVGIGCSHGASVYLDVGPSGREGECLEAQVSCSTGKVSNASFTQRQVLCDDGHRMLERGVVELYAMSSPRGAGGTLETAGLSLRAVVLGEDGVVERSVGKRVIASSLMMRTAPHGVE